MDNHLTKIFPLNSSHRSGIITHSYLPFVHHIRIPSCVVLTIEVVRLSIILVQVYHLLAVALVHYCGSVRPQHYAVVLSPHKIKVLLACLWLMPRKLVGNVGLLSTQREKKASSNIIKVYLF